LWGGKQDDFTVQNYQLVSRAVRNIFLETMSSLQSLYFLNTSPPCPDWLWGPPSLLLNVY